MKNLDMKQKEKAAILAKINQAAKDGNDEAIASASAEFFELIQNAVMEEARGLVQSNDNTILAGRGVRTLTSEETNYYSAVIGAMKSGNPKQALSDTTVAMPVTVIDAVFEDLIEEHPLLAALNFQNTSGLIEYIINTGSRPLAVWGALTGTISEEIARGFEKIDLSQKKLSAFLPVAKSFLDLGPAWIDRFVRAQLGESIANGLEAGVIKGNGLLEPIGMIKNLDGAIDQSTGYPDKTKVPVSDFSPESYGGLISLLTVGRNGNIRTVGKVLLIVNPIDYLNKIMPATTQLINGAYVSNIFPYPTEVITSSAVTIGSAVMGIGDKYFIGIGTQKSGKIEYSDENKFLEDQRLYLVKLYGAGRPVDNVSFLHLDISALKPDFPIVRTTNYVDATLKSLVVTGATISPAFDKDVTYYTAATTDATNKVTIAATDVNATVAMTLNGASATSGASQTWVEGQNIIYATVSNAGTVKGYVLIVTYTVSTEA